MHDSHDLLQNGCWKCFDCKHVTKKRDARRSLNRLKKTKPDIDSLTCRQKRAEYKSPVKEKKHHYKTSIHQAVCGNKRISSKSWVILQKKRQRRTKQPDISIRTWTDHFENVLGNESAQVLSKDSTNETVWITAWSWYRSKCKPHS